MPLLVPLVAQRRCVRLAAAISGPRIALSAHTANRPPQTPRSSCCPHSKWELRHGIVEPLVALHPRTQTGPAGPSTKHRQTSCPCSSRSSATMRVLTCKVGAQALPAHGLHADRVQRPLERLWRRGQGIYPAHFFSDLLQRLAAKRRHQSSCSSLSEGAKWELAPTSWCVHEAIHALPEPHEYRAVGDAQHLSRISGETDPQRPFGRMLLPLQESSRDVSGRDIPLARERSVCRARRGRVGLVRSTRPFNASGSLNPCVMRRALARLLSSACLLHFKMKWAFRMRPAMADDSASNSHTAFWKKLASSLRLASWKASWSLKLSVRSSRLALFFLTPGPT